MRKLGLFGILVASSLFLGGLALAGLDETKIAEAKKAADEFVVLAKGWETSGEVPRQADPKVKALLDAAFDRAAFGNEVLPLSVSNRFSEMLNNANRVGFAYMLAGTGVSDTAALGGDPAKIEQVERNLVRYAPEAGRWFDYQVFLNTTMADSTLAFLATAKPDVLARDQVKAGLGQIRQGIVQSLGGVLQMMGSDALDDGWCRDRLQALNEAAPRVARLLTPEQIASL